jgi:hypothetical protein
MVFSSPFDSVTGLLLLLMLLVLAPANGADAQPDKVEAEDDFKLIAFMGKWKQYSSSKSSFLLPNKCASIESKDEC